MKSFWRVEFDRGTTKLHARILRGKGVQKQKPNMFTIGSSTSATFDLPVYIYIIHICLVSLVYIYIILSLRMHVIRVRCCWSLARWTDVSTTWFKWLSRFPNRMQGQPSLQHVPVLSSIPILEKGRVSCLGKYQKRCCAHLSKRGEGAKCQTRLSTPLLLIGIMVNLWKPQAIAAFQEEKHA